MALRIVTMSLVLNLFPLQQLSADETPPNPCEGGPNATCEDMLARAALAWERRYHDERSAHLYTLETCSQALDAAPASTPVQDDKLWVYLGVGGAVLLTVGGVLLGAVAL